MRTRSVQAWLVAVGLVLALGGCAGRVACESPCWPGPRLGPACPALCAEEAPEAPCPPRAHGTPRVEAP